ncbi:HD domain-containing protein [Patescibacteria group bacterium]|nr:HD domain-containing protein [Patescibacteria group bacterium]MBU1890398.1 HD domain-containing protein [Patescibacteria group bacterium]
MDILKLTKEFAKKEYAKQDKEHGWKHISEVMDTALQLAKSYPEVDLEILKLAVLLHDVSYFNYETHVEESIKTAEKFLHNKAYPKDKIKKVLDVMIAHSGPHRRKLGDTKLIEGKIIYDSDKYVRSHTLEGMQKYYPRFYLNETRELLKKTRPELFK